MESEKKCPLLMAARFSDCSSCRKEKCEWWVQPENWSEGRCAIACIACNGAFMANDIEAISSRIG